MTKKLIASGIILLILGTILIVISKTSVTQLDNLLLYITGHVMAIGGIVLLITALTKIIAERL